MAAALLAMRLESATPLVPMSSRLGPWRGGSSDGGGERHWTSEHHDDDDAAVDAYIEQLIAGVASSSEVESSDVEETENVLVGATADEDTEALDESVEQVAHEGGDGDDDRTIAVTAAGAEDDDEPDDASDDAEKFEREDDGIEQDGESMEAEGAQAAVATSTQAAISASTSGDDRPLPRPQPPPPIYRFLLRRGRVGHVLVMALVLISEFLQLYLPTLAKLLQWLAALLFPARPLSADEDYHDIPTSRTPSVVSARTGQSKKQRKKMIREADQAALAQLKKIGDVHSAKYRYVSAAFLKRHGLGPYADQEEEGGELVATILDDDESESGSIAKGGVSSSGPSRSKKRRKVKKKEGEVDWIVDALTRKTKKPRSLVRPTLSVEVGPGGPAVSVGVEFSPRRDRNNIRESLTQALRVTETIKRAGPRSSDKDGGTVFGRIRAAAGANSMVSRSLLGAYPGDAVPPMEAASAEGVLMLAERYGYGDWSEEDDEADSSSTGGKRRRRRQRPVSRAAVVHEADERRSPRHRRRRSSGGVGLEFAFGSSNANSVPLTTRDSAAVEMASRPRSKPANRNTGELSSTTAATRRDAVRVRAPLDRSTEMKERSQGRREATIVRPAMDRVNDVKKRRRRRTKEEDS